jgi:hypothetical protein
MKLTNHTNLPLPLYVALRDDDYTRGAANISATGLLQPPRKAALEELHADALEEDAADKAAILIGKAVHAYIAAKATGELSDKRRLMMAVNGWVVSGQTDHVDDEMFTVAGGRILDYKSTSVNEWKYGLKEERAQQLNIYAEILRSNGFNNVTGLTAVLIFKDWSATQARYNRGTSLTAEMLRAIKGAPTTDYPPHSIMEVDVPLWPREQAQSFILERVKLHQAARLELPLCTDDERWKRDTWAVRKLGNKSATRLHDTEAEAQAHAAELLAKDSRVPYDVEYRPGSPTRCLHYCTVGAMGLCSQYTQWQEENANG